MSPDSIVCLGLTLLAGILATILLPTQSLGFFEKSKTHINTYFRFWAALFLAALLALLIFINRKILFSFMNSADEHSCYFLAECLRKGKLWVAAHPASEFFNVTHVGNRDGKWFSVYPPGWPLLYALGLSIGCVDWMNPVLSVLALIFFHQTAKILFNRETAWLGTFFTGFSAFYLFTSASYFSHSTCLLSISLFFYSVVKLKFSADRRHRNFWATTAGLAAGYGLITRYLTVAAVLTPFAMTSAIQMAKKKERWSKAKTIFVVIFSLFLGVLLFQNKAISGHFLEAPNHYDKPYERLGFFPYYTPLHALVYFITRFFFLSDWAPPALILLYFFSLFEQDQSSGLRFIFKTSFLWIAGAYLFYYSWGGNQYGPRYYYEGFPFLVYSGIHFAVRKYREGSIPVKKFIAGILISSAVVSGYQILKQAELYEIISGERKELYVAAERMIQKPAVVFIHGFLGDKLVLAEEDAVRNSPWLNSKILYAHDVGAKNQALRQYFPDREFYLGTYDRKTKKAVLTRILSF